MTDLWTTLIPLILGSAVLPVQIAITVLLLRSGSGRIAAVACVTGMTVVRLAQGIVIGFVLGAARADELRRRLPLEHAPVHARVQRRRRPPHRRAAGRHRPPDVHGHAHARRAADASMKLIRGKLIQRTAQ